MSHDPRHAADESPEIDQDFSITETFDSDSDPSPPPRQRAHDAVAAKFAPQRLAKILAAAGIAARRKCEEFVTTGRVTVDGEVIKDMAFRADPFSQKIQLDGETIKLQRKVYFVLNKPRGVVCTNFDPSGRPRIIDLFPQFRERLFTIGRLDEESEGLLLVTNDGELANRMAHPRYRVPKFYLCHVKGVPSAETLATLKKGMYFEEGKFHVEGVRMKKVVGDSAYLDIVLNEGQNREIRRLLARVDHKVMRLKRVGFGPIRLGDLPCGAFRPLNTAEVALLTDLSQQRAHLDKTAGRGRPRPERAAQRPTEEGQSLGKRPPFVAKKSFGGKPPAGAKRPYGSKPPVGEKRSYGSKPAYGQASGKPPRGGPAFRQDAQGSRRPPRRVPSADENTAFQPEALTPDSDFNGGRRRFVTDETPAASFNRRPARGTTRRPPRGRAVSNESAPAGGEEGTRERRPARGPRRFGQAGNRELPARGRGQRPARPPRPMTADGKEILQGKVTGYRTVPKEGLGRRRRVAIQGMQINRKQRQERRKKTDE